MGITSKISAKTRTARVINRSLDEARSGRIGPE
jgi:hypothetical protein